MSNNAAKPFALSHANSGKRRLVILLAAGIAVQAILWTISEPSELFSDFYKAYFPAGELILTNGLSAAWPFREEEAAVNFVNIPIVAWLFAPLAAFGEPATGYVFLAVGIAAVMATIRIFVHGSIKRPMTIAIIALFLVNGPLVNSLREGNTTHFVLLMLVSSLYLIARRAKFLGGMLLGLCAVLKLPLTLLGLYFVLRRDWLVSLGIAAAMIALIGLSVLVFGVETHLDWYRRCVVPFLGKVIPAFNVQSVDGFLMRLGTGASLLQEWLPVEPAFWHRIVRYPILLLLLVSAVITILRESRADQTGARHANGFVIILTLSIVSSPLSWSHYYLLLLLPFGLYVFGALSMPDDAVTRSLMTGAIILASLPVVNFNLQQGDVAELVARTVVSLPLFGGLLLFIALIRGTWRCSSVRHA